MPHRKQNAEPAPPVLLEEASRAREIVEDLLNEGRDLLARPRIELDQIEEFQADCNRWSTKTTERLKRMWDRSHYADMFYMAGNYGVSWNSESPYQRLNRAQKYLREQIHDLESQLDIIEIASSAPTRPTGGQQASRDSEPLGNVIIQGGTVGSVNVGHMVRDISSNVAAVSGPSSAEVKLLTNQFAQVLAQTAALTSEQRQEALEHLDFVADAAAKPGAQKPSVLRSVVDRLASIAKGSEAIYRVYSEWEPAIRPFLQGHHG